MDGQIAAAEMQVTKLTESRAALAAAITTAEGELTTLQAQRDGLADDIAPLLTQEANTEAKLRQLELDKAAAVADLEDQRARSVALTTHQPDDVAAGRLLQQMGVEVSSGRARNGWCFPGG